MSEIIGTKIRMSISDFYQKCTECGKIFYFSRDCNGKSVICPHCGHKH